MTYNNDTALDQEKKNRDEEEEEGDDFDDDEILTTTTNDSFVHIPQNFKLYLYVKMCYTMPPSIDIKYHFLYNLDKDNGALICK